MLPSSTSIASYRRKGVSSLGKGNGETLREMADGGKDEN